MNIDSVYGDYANYFLFGGWVGGRGSDIYYYNTEAKFPIVTDKIRGPIVKREFIEIFQGVLYRDVKIFGYHPNISIKNKAFFENTIYSSDINEPDEIPCAMRKLYPDDEFIDMVEIYSDQNEKYFSFENKLFWVGTEELVHLVNKYFKHDNLFLEGISWKPYRTNGAACA
jgi:hypothetical protein